MALTVVANVNKDNILGFTKADKHIHLSLVFIIFDHLLAYLICVNTPNVIYCLLNQNKPHL